MIALKDKRIGLNENNKSSNEYGFIHSTKPEDFWIIVPYFEEGNKQLVVIVIDENKLLAEMK